MSNEAAPTLPPMMVAQAKDVMRRGRPAKYTPEFGEHICAVIAESDLSVRALCDQRSDFPSRVTLATWKRTYPEFRELLAYTLQGRYEDMLQETIAIADDGDRDYQMEVSDETGVTRMTVNKEHLSRTEQKIDTRFRLAATLRPKDEAADPAAARPGDNARDITPPATGGLIDEPVIHEQDPLYHASLAWERPVDA